MHEQPRIEKYIHDILAGSGLPMERRAEVAEEFLGHLEQLIETKSNMGLESLAVDDALREFGEPEIVRSRLRRQQRRLDGRTAIAKFRRQIWRFVMLDVFFSAAPPIYLSILSPEPISLALRLLGGLSLFVLFGVFLSITVPVGDYLEQQIKRQRPYEEFGFVNCFLRWNFMVALALMSSLVFAMLWIAAAGPLLKPSLVTDHFPLSFWYNFGVAFLESPKYNFGLSALMVIGSSFTGALYERSRCIALPMTHLTA